MSCVITILDNVCTRGTQRYKLALMLQIIKHWPAANCDCNVIVIVFFDLHFGRQSGAFGGDMSGSHKLIVVL